MPSARLNQGWVGVIHGVCETRVSGGPPAGRAEVAAPAPAVPRRAAVATASVQKAVVAQRVDTGRG